jgi:hypothetical protein
VIRAILEVRGEVVHVPGPAGLPGGYPVSFRRGRPEVIPFSGLGLIEMQRINEASQPFDGIDSIQADGTIVFSEDSVGVMADLMGYRCHLLSPAEAGERATELIGRFTDLARRHGVDLAGLDRVQARGSVGNWLP